MSLWSAARARVRGWVGRTAIAAAAAGVPGFQRWSIGGPIDALVQGAWGNSWLEGGPVSREDALLVAAVERGRDEICAAVATLPLVNYRGRDLIPNAFLDQPDPDVPNVVMVAQTIEDLIFDGISWWRKTGYDYRGFPTSARRVVNVSLTPPNGSVTTPAPLPSGIDPRGATVWVDGVEVSAFEMIRFDSPLRPLLISGARAIRKALLVDALAAMYADNPTPKEQFTDTDDRTIAKMSDEEIDAFLATYKANRKRGAPAWIPAAVKRMDVNTPSPADLQLIQQAQQCSLELALKMGLDPEDVGVNTTSRTYFNGVDRGMDKINRVFGPFIKALTDRLSMGDVTPRGQRVRADLSDYLKPDPTTQATYWGALKQMQVVDAQWIGEQAGIPADVVQRAQLAGPPPVGPALPPGGVGQNARMLPAQLGPALTARAMAGQFSAGPPTGMLTFAGADFDFAAPPAKVDEQARTITGLAVPYGAVARKYGVGFRFRPGALEYDAANLNRLRAKKDHQDYVGVTKAVQDTKSGPVVTLKILDGPDGSPQKMQRDQLLMDAAGGLADGLSVGVEFSLNPEDGDVVWSEGEQVFDVVRATWNETSVTPDPAFTGARVTKVAASRFGGFAVDCQHCGRPHPQGMACQVAQQLYPAPVAGQVAAAAPVAAGQVFTGVDGRTYAVPPAGWAGPPGVLGPVAVQTPVQAPVQMTAGPTPPPAQLPADATSTDALNAALSAYVADAVRNGNVAARPPADAGQFAQPVNPGALAIPGAPPATTPTGPGWTSARVTEPDPYRIGFTKDGSAVLSRGTHDFSTDVIAALRDSDKAAADRALAFVQRKMAAQFNVATTDVDEVNPSRQRPEMYVDQRSYRYPIWSAINKGALSDITPFVFPKFNSASGLVGAHTQGTEPSTGSFTVTNQTVQPTGYSGKARINREVWDQGGNPQVSTLIWNQMVKGVNEALEAAAVTELNNGTFTALNTFTAGALDRAAAGKTLGSELAHGIALLQFARGGYAFTDAFGQADLYLALADAADSQGQPLYPMINPTNRNGTSDRLYSVINVAGQDIAPAWALAAAGQTAATKSYLIDRQSVHGWASAPMKLTLDQVAVAYVDLGVWGYQATAVSDTNGVRTISWDPVA